MKQNLAVSLSWVVPVAPVMLVASVQTCVELLLALYALRLCRTFGKGPNAYITTLPKEILAMIEVAMVAAERSKRIETLQTEYRCFNEKCRPTDHFTPAENAHKLNECHNPWGPPGSGPGIRSWDEVCNENFNSWIGRTSILTKGSTDGTSTHKSLLFDIFGLHVWVAHQKTEDAQNWQQQSVAYLVLPAQRALNKTCWIFPERGLCNFDSQDPDYGETLTFGAAFARDLLLPGPLSDQNKRKFSRALSILGLRGIQEDLESHLSASESDVMPESNHDAGETDESSNKPRLKVLIRADMSQDY